MRYYCDICLIDIKKKSKHSHLKYKAHKEFEKYRRTIKSFKIIDIKDVDEILYLYIKDYNKKYTQYLLKGQVELIFNNRDCEYLITDMINIKSYVSWTNYLKDVITNLKDEGYDFSHIGEMDIITLAHKRDITYEFYLRHNMPAVEWKINQLINKNKNLINKFPRNWKHPINTRFGCYRNNIF